MDPVIINNTNYSESLLRICNRPDVTKERRRLLFAAPLYLLSLFYWGRRAITAPSAASVFWALLCVAGLVFCVYAFIFAERNLLKKFVLRMMEMYGGFISTRLLFGPEHIINETSNGRRNTISYDRIRSVSEEGGLYLLRMERTLILPVDKAGFEKGSTEEFEAFIRTAAPKAEIRLNRK